MLSFKGELPSIEVSKEEVIGYVKPTNGSVVFESAAHTNTGDPKNITLNEVELAQLTERVRLENQRS